MNHASNTHTTVRPELVEGLTSTWAGASTGSARTGVFMPQTGPLLTRAGWSSFVVALLVVCAVAPVLNLLVPDTSAFHLSDYLVGLLANSLLARNPDHPPLHERDADRRELRTRTPAHQAPHQHPGG